MQASLQTTIDECAAGRFWTHMEGRHVQGLGTTSLYPANTKYSEVGGQRFRGKSRSGPKKYKAHYQIRPSS